MKKAQTNSQHKKNAKTLSVKVPKKKQQLLTAINAIFGTIAAIAFCYACYIAYSLIQYELDSAIQQTLIGSFIKSLYYPIFYLLGYVISRRAFLTRNFQLAIWFALLIPLTPFLLLSIVWN